MVLLIRLLCGAVGLLLLLSPQNFCEGKHGLTHRSCTVSDTHPLLVKAKSAYHLRDYGKAIRFCLTAIDELKKHGDDANLLAAYTLAGGAYVKAGKFDDAISMLEKGLAMATAKMWMDATLPGDLYFQLGVYYDRLGNADLSLEYHKKALELRMQGDGKEDLAVAQSYVGLGELYLYTILDFRKANSWMEKAVAILEPILRHDDLDLYFPYFYLAQVNRRLGNHDKALAYAFRALSIIQSRPEYNLYLERCYTLLGDIYYATADFSDAIANYKSGITESIKNEGPANYNLILKYTNLGAAYGESNEPEEAISCFKRSLNILSKHPHHSVQLKAGNFLHLGRMYQKTGRPDSARLYLNEHLAQQRSAYGDKHAATSEAYRYLAKYYQATGDTDHAAQYIQQAIVSAIPGFEESRIHANPSVEDIKDRYSLFQLFGDKGSILIDRSAANRGSVADLEVSLQCFQLSDTLMHLSRNTWREEGTKLFFADHYHNIYQHALHASYLLFEQTGQRNYIEAALMFMEKSKALLLAEALNKAEVFSQAGLPDSLREMERSLTSALAAYRGQLEADAHHHNHSPSDLQARILDLTRKQEKLLDTIARAYPNYFQIKYQKPSSIREIQSYARERNTAFVEYFWGSDRIFILGLTADKLVFKQVQMAESQADVVRQYYESLQQPAWKENDRSFEKFLSSARRVYDSLLNPVLADLDAKNLVIVRDGPLLLIPFESLLVTSANSKTANYQKLDYLIRHHPVSYAHSADLLLKKASTLMPSNKEQKVLGFSYSPIATSVDNKSLSSPAELPGAAREIAAISKILPGTFLMGDDATEQKFKTMAADYDILHLAVHGKSDPTKQFSGTLFFKTSSGGEEDGELHVYELYDLALKARLTVLSACESGVGRIFRGEGVFSIARAFAYAGCPTTVMTLWPVSDEASSLIMGNFYKHLRDGEPIDIALRAAKLNYLTTADPQLAHPSYWAAYVPAGNMDPVIPSSYLTKILIAISLLLLIAAPLALWISRMRRRQRYHDGNKILKPAPPGR